MRFRRQRQPQNFEEFGPEWGLHPRYFTPEADQTVGRPRCRAPLKVGRCPHWALPGSTYCQWHGGVPSRSAEVQKLRTANRHATELVTRLLRENRALRQSHQRYADQHFAISRRLFHWLEGDGTKPREVLADLQEILGRG